MRHARLLESDLGDAPRDGLGAIERARRRQLRDRDQVLLVHLRDEAPRHGLEAEPGEDDEPAVDCERDAAVPHRDPENARIVVPGAGEAAIEALEEPAEE